MDGEVFLMRRMLWMALVVVVLGMPACSSEPPAPPTFRVDGKIVRKDGKPYTGGGSVEFRLAAHPQHGGFGVVADDGTFTLKTIAGNRSVEGAQEGEHTVTFRPRGDGQDSRSVTLKTRYSVKAGDTNTLIVKLEQ
jgi:hypothetical protein